jgi:hypothetical protein
LISGLFLPRRRVAGADGRLSTARRRSQPRRDQRRARRWHREGHGSWPYPTLQHWRRDARSAAPPGGDRPAPDDAGALWPASPSSVHETDARALLGKSAHGGLAHPRGAPRNNHGFSLQAGVSGERHEMPSLRPSSPAAATPPSHHEIHDRVKRRGAVKANGDPRCCRLSRAA